MDPRSESTLGRTDLRVSHLGLGTATLGGWPTPVAEVDGLATIQAAWDVGVRYFDTAPFYGYGQSERWVGRVLGTQPRAAFTLSTKVGRLLREPEGYEEPFFKGTGSSLRPVWDFSREGVRRSLEESLERLGLDRVDIALIHDPDDHLDEALDGAYVALDELRSAGVLGAVGVGTNFTEPLVYLAERADFDCVLVAGRYTLLEQPALDRLLPLAEKQQFSLIAGGVYNSGLLVDPKPGATYDYAPAEDHLVERAVRLQEVCGRHGVPLMAAAIQFPLAHPAVASIASGARAPDDVRENARLLHISIPDDLWAELREEHLLPDHAPTPAAA